MTLHNENVALLGSTQSSFKEVGNRKGSIAAGAVVRLKNDGTISTAKADGNLLGVSLGTDLSDAGHTAICYKGIGVPLRLTSGFTPTIGAAVTIDDVTGLGKAAGSGVTAVNAVFSKLLSNGAMPESGGSNVEACLIDFPGGL